MKNTDKQLLTSSEVELTDMLKAHGILPTQQRVMIARVLFAQCGHYSADQVMRQVNAGDDRVSKATVYNTLGLFARSGLVREVIVDPTRVFYDPNTRHHHHFYNVDTGELVDIEQEQLDISALPELPTGTVAAGVDVIVRIRNESAVN
ncbi:MAG: Fur family transcriptional regulator [Gammaproteobacteria bacterium]